MRSINYCTIPCFYFINDKKKVKLASTLQWLPNDFIKINKTQRIYAKIDLELVSLSEF